MPVYDSPRFNVGNPGVGNGAVETAAGLRMLQTAIDNGIGIGTKAQEEATTKNTMELLKMEKEGKPVTQKDYDRVGLVNSKMLEEKMEKLRKYDRDVVTQDRNFGLDQSKTGAYLRNINSQIANRDPEAKFVRDMAGYKIKSDIDKKNGRYAKSGYKSKGKGSMNNLTPSQIFVKVLNDKGIDPYAVDGENLGKYLKQGVSTTSNNKELYEKFFTNMEATPIQDWFFGRDGAQMGSGFWQADEHQQALRDRAAIIKNNQNNK